MALVPNGYDPREGVYDVEMRFMIASDGDATAEQVEFQRYFREDVHTLAQRLNSKVEDGREKSLALTHLEEALMWAGKAIFK